MKEFLTRWFRAADIMINTFITPPYVYFTLTLTNGIINNPNNNWPTKCFARPAKNKLMQQSCFLRLILPLFIFAVIVKAPTSEKWAKQWCFEFLRWHVFVLCNFSFLLCIFLFIGFFCHQITFKHKYILSIYVSRLKCLEPETKQSLPGLASNVTSVHGNLCLVWVEWAPAVCSCFTHQLQWQRCLGGRIYNAHLLPGGFHNRWFLLK